VPWSWKSCLALTSFAAAFSVLAFFRMRGTGARLKNLRLGLEGEVAVGQFLDEYCRERGYKVLHDLQGDGFNVDHVLIGPGGIFAIDTKTHSKPTMGDPVITYDGQSVLIDGHAPDRDPIKQAKANARFVAELLAGRGECHFHRFLEAVILARRVGLGRRGLADQVAQVDEMFLAGGPLGELDALPLVDESLSFLRRCELRHARADPPAMR
jgi:hypothetical protein